MKCPNHVYAVNAHHPRTNPYSRRHICKYGHTNLSTSLSKKNQPLTKSQHFKMRPVIRNLHIHLTFVCAMLRLSVCMANGISSMDLLKKASHTNKKNPRSHTGLSRRRRNNSVRTSDDIYRRRGTDASGSKRELEGEEANTDIYYRKYYYEEHEQEDAKVEEDAHSNTLAEDQEGLENNGTSTTSDTAPETDYILEDIYYYDKTVYYYYDDDEAGKGEGGYAPEFLGYRPEPPKPPLKCGSGKTRKKSKKTKSAKGKGQNTNSPTPYYYESCTPTRAPSKGKSPTVNSPTVEPTQNPNFCNPAQSLDCPRPTNPIG
jgi:hypothetical protein